MDIIASTLIFVLITCLCIYLFRSNSDENSSIPYAAHESYPLIGHVISSIRDRKAFLTRCRQRYGQCFKIRFFNKRFTFVLSPSDWTIILRNPAFYFPGNDVAKNLFDTFVDYFGRSRYLLEL